jgi:flagellar motor switch/type III secretory pathway protein FliN
MDTPDVLNRFGGLPFAIEVELGTISLPIGEIFDLKEGMVLRTDCPAGEPFTLRAGGAELAAVEVVVIGEALSVRVKNFFDKPTSGAGANGTN